jgi:hypothetical protein
LHARKILENSRWEDSDFDYENKNGEGEEGMLGWLGDGWSVADREEGDTKWHLDEVDCLLVNI